MNKKIYFITIISFMILILTACSNKEGQNAVSNEKLSIVTTIFPPYDFAREVAGDYADISMLIKPGVESHSFDPTPQDIKKIQNADLFIYVGGENDVWIEDILNSIEGNKPKTLKLVNSVPTVKEEIIEGMEDRHGHHDDEFEHSKEIDDHSDNHEEETDEHVWTSPKNAIKITQKIKEELIKKDTKNATLYENNAKEFINKLDKLDNDLKQVISSSKRNLLVFGDRFPFRYLADEYNLDYFAAFSGCSTETEASPSTVAFLVNKVKEKEIPVVFTIEFSNGKIADSITDATGAKKLMLHSCHNVSADEFANGATYLSLMNENINKLREALN